MRARSGRLHDGGSKLDGTRCCQCAVKLPIDAVIDSRADDDTVFIFSSFTISCCRQTGSIHNKNDAGEEQGGDVVPGRARPARRWPAMVAPNQNGLSCAMFIHPGRWPSLICQDRHPAPRRRRTVPSQSPSNGAAGRHVLKNNQRPTKVLISGKVSLLATLMKNFGIAQPTRPDAPSSTEYRRRRNCTRIPAAVATCGSADGAHIGHRLFYAAADRQSQTSG